MRTVPQPLLAPALRFATVGVGNTLIGLAVIWVAWRWWGFGHVAANAVGYAVGFAFSFTLNRGWTFRHRGAAAPALLRFALVCALAYALNLVVLAAGRAALGESSFWPQVLAVAAYSVAAFLGSHWYAFRSRPC